MPIPKDKKPLSVDELTDILSYDPISGALEWLVGDNAGQLIDLNKHVTKPKKLRAQHPNRLPIEKHGYKPSIAGYTIISKATYDAVNAGEYDIKIGLKQGKSTGKETTEYVDDMVRPREVFMRQYRLRSRTVKNTYDVMTFYCWTNPKPYPRLSIKGQRYKVQHLIYMIMGYDIPPKIPCRNDNFLDMSWDNIKPRIEPIKPERKTRKPIGALNTPKPLVSSIYSHTRCIKPFYDGLSITVHDRTMYAKSMPEAIKEYDALIDQLNGTKRRLRNGNMQVKRPEGSNFFKRINNIG